MLAMAAVQGQGVVLLPRMLVEAELARGELRIVCERPLRGQRAYYLITPETAHEKTALQQLRAWLPAWRAALVSGLLFGLFLGLLLFVRVGGFLLDAVRGR